jgi:hypothetical protein
MVEYPIISDKKIKVDYVTAAQGRIYIGGILLDECYDIQYTYQESKEPIYGYNSKHFDAILPGQVIIYGSFTINYKHDKYLWAILKNLQPGESAQKSIDRQAENSKAAQNFKNKLIAYKKLQQTLQDDKRKLAELQSYGKEIDANLVIQDQEKLAQTNNFKVKINNIQSDKDSFINGLGDTEQEALRMKLKTFNEGINDPQASGGLVQLNKQHEDNLKSINDELNRINQEVSDLQTTLSNLQSLLSPGQNEPVLSDANRFNYTNGINEVQKRIDDNNLVVDNLLTLRDETTQQFNSAITQNSNQLKGMLDGDSNLKKAISFDTTLARVQTDQVKFLESTPTLDIQGEKTKNLAAIKTQKEKVDTSKTSIETIKKEIAALKEKEKQSGMDLAAQLDTMGSANNLRGELTKRDWRPEDFGKFNIMFDYNGNTHKILESCELTGHSHALAVSGVPVKEQYNFIARKIV